MAKYDCPAAIDKVLELSGKVNIMPDVYFTKTCCEINSLKEKTYWIGHSMGTTLGYGTIATNPEYNNKVILQFEIVVHRQSTCNEKDIVFIFRSINEICLLFFLDYGNVHAGSLRHSRLHEGTAQGSILAV